MISIEILLKAYRMMCLARFMSETYEANRNICRYVHSTSRGHEAIQLATAFQLQPIDFVSPYYRDESMLLGLGFSPLELMLQLLAKGDDIFSGGREYYSHPNSLAKDKPIIIHQSSATGMQAIPATGIAQGIQYLDAIGSDRLKKGPAGELPIVLCSLGDASITEGEVSEALQFAVLKKLPIIYLVQDNSWGISVSAKESRVMDAVQYAEGFPGLNTLRLDGSDFEQSLLGMGQAIASVRKKSGPFLVHASVPLLGHHTSGVRKESYRTSENLLEHSKKDPGPLLREKLKQAGITEEELSVIESGAADEIITAFETAINAPGPDAAKAGEYVFVPGAITEEKGSRSCGRKEKILMVDAALYAVREIMEDYPEAILFGQDVGKRLGGVFREAATLADQFGEARVFNTAIQEAYIIGSTTGLCATGVRPIVEIQFGDYIYPGINQLVTEISKSCYLSCGKFPVQTLIRVPVGAYGGGGPYHSGSIESMLLSIKGIKIAYPSNAADMKGLMKAAFLDPNPVIMLEHKGLYWSRVPGTEEAKTFEPGRDYILPLGKAAVAVPAAAEKIKDGNSCCVITYGMGVYWAKEAAKRFDKCIEVIDLRSLFPLDEEMIFDAVKKHGKCLVLTEEQQINSFAEALAGRISYACFKWLDAPVEVMGAMNVPAIPMNIILEQAVLPDGDKVYRRLAALLSL